jgi:hypothetical protein
MRARRLEEGHDPHDHGGAQLAASWARYSGFAGVLIAFLLLAAFYLTVAGAAHRADLARQQARLELDRQAACSAFARAADRSLCAVTLAHRDAVHAFGGAPQPANDLLSSATYRERHVGSQRPQRTAALY